MLKSKKNVFWEALVITVVIFLAGLLMGMLVETSNMNKVSDLYLQSQISFSDVAATSNLLDNTSVNCDLIKNDNIKVANRVYQEAKILELYENSGKLTDSMKLLHKKYDLLRALLWISNQKSLERCHDYNLIIYLYDYNSDDTNKKAEQNVWSKILFDVKSQNQDTLLLPIAANQNLTTVDYLIHKYDVKQFPAVIINDDKVIYKLENASTVLQSLN